MRGLLASLWFTVAGSVLIPGVMPGMLRAAEMPPPAPTAITVWPFDSLVHGKESNSGERLLLQELLPDLLGAELSTSPRLRLVERQRLGDVLAEQKLGASELADDATRLRLGRLVGARWMVFGSHLRIGDAWQIDARIVDVESSRIVATSSESGQGAGYALVVGRLAARLLKSLP